MLNMSDIRLMDVKNSNLFDNENLYKTNYIELEKSNIANVFFSSQLSLSMK